MPVKVTYKPNHQVVIRKTQDAAEVIGRKFGAFVMTTAKRSIKKSKRPSQPGSPPKDGGILKRFIRFAYDESTRSVVIGPGLLPGRTNAPTVLESGGSGARWVIVNGTRRKINVSYKARPFMVPALEKRLPELPLLWQNAIKE